MVQNKARPIGTSRTRKAMATARPTTSLPVSRVLTDELCVCCDGGKVAVVARGCDGNADREDDGEDGVAVGRNGTADRGKDDKDSVCDEFNVWKTGIAAAPSEMTTGGTFMEHDGKSRLETNDVSAADSQ